MEALRFDYEDSKGSVTTRELVNWVDDGWLVKGHSTVDGGFRTFRRDRILEVRSGGEGLKPIQMPQRLTDRDIASRKARADSIEILFTGFSKDRRAQLEMAASDAGINVRKTVTQALSFICAGPNAGPTKLRKAQGKGVAVLDEADYLWLLETGELPE